MSKDNIENYISSLTDTHSNETKNKYLLAVTNINKEIDIRTERLLFLRLTILGSWEGSGSLEGSCSWEGPELLYFGSFLNSKKTKFIEKIYYCQWKP